MGLRSWLAHVRRWFRADTARAAQTSSTRLVVEELENRRVPAAAVADTYLAALYLGFLGRALDQDGLTFWGGQLRAGATRDQVASAILDSPEAHGRQLQILYLNFLGRPIDTPGLQFWGSVFEDQNATYERVKAGILGSPEFFLRAANNDNIVFLDTIYRTQLNRPLDNAGLAFWSGRLVAGLSRESAVAQILQSDEANRVKMIGIYQEVLARPLDSLGDDFWVENVLRSGRPLEDALAGVTGSDEFRDQLTASLFRSNLDDPNVAADTFFREGFRFDSLLPAIEILNRNFITDQRINTLATSVPLGTVTNLITLPPAGVLATGLPTLVTTTPALGTVSPTGVTIPGFSSGLNSGFLSPFGTVTTGSSLPTLGTTTGLGLGTVSPTGVTIPGFSSGLNSGFLSPFGSTMSVFPSFFI
ncbi:MAG: DUF4214 domain-containing protein [Gemmataceae bacterium]|nr:DUF4214 domain-containing protein [Gemmataceae bacterium]